MVRGTRMDEELTVRLRDDEIIERAETLSAKLVHIGALRKKRREDLRSANALIESEIDEVARLARTIAGSQELRKQGELKFDDEVVTSTEAQSAESVAAPPPQFHRDGARCAKDPCKRRHLTLAQVRAAGVVPEGEPLVPEETGEASGPTDVDAQIADSIGTGAVEGAAAEEAEAQCSRCGAPLFAMEVVRKLGICEPCEAAVGHVAKPSARRRGGAVRTKTRERRPGEMRLQKAARKAKAKK